MFPNSKEKFQFSKLSFEPSPKFGHLLSENLGKAKEA